MKAYEIQATVKEEGRLELPVHLVKRLPQGQTFRVIILVPESDETESPEWAQITAEEFSKGYREEDSIYDRM